MTIFCFNTNKEIIIDGCLLEYSPDLLHRLVLQEEIYVVIYPGSYTGIRKSVAIAKAIQIIKPDIKFYGTNLLINFASLFFPIVFFAEKHIIHIYNKNTQQISVNFSIEEVFQKYPDIVGNIINQNQQYIDFSLNNLYDNLNIITKKPLKLEYYDRFS